MKQLIVLLRGINVGGRNIKMSELKSCLDAAGFRNIITVLQTGNVILEYKKDAASLKEEVENVLTTTFSYPAKVLIVTLEDLKNIVSGFPFAELGPEFHKYVVFTEQGFAKELVANAPELDKTVEAIAGGKDVVYWYVQKGMTLDSAFGKYMNKASSKNLCTTRNLNTLEKILMKCNG